MRPRPWRYARDLRTLSVRPALAARATCAVPTCCVRSSAHGMGTARAECVRLHTPSAHNAHDLTWCSALFCAMFMSLFGLLFMDTVD